MERARLRRLEPELGAVRVLAEIRDDPHRFATDRGLRGFAGTAPITRASGRSSYVKARKVRNKRLGDADPDLSAGSADRRWGTNWGTTIAVEPGLARTVNDARRCSPAHETRISRRGGCFGTKKSTSAALPTVAHDRLRIAASGRSAVVLVLVGSRAQPSGKAIRRACLKSPIAPATVRYIDRISGKKAPASVCSSGSSPSMTTISRQSPMCITPTGRRQARLSRSS